MRNVLFVAAALAVAAPAASARRIAPPSVAQRLAAARTVVVGKVESVGEKAIDAELYKGDTTKLQTAEITVSETLLGTPAKKLTIAYAGPMGRLNPGDQLAKGETMALLLVPHPTKKVYLLQNYTDVIRKDSEDEMAQLKKFAKLLADPKKGLASKDAEERYLTAAMVVARHRTAPPGGVTKMEALTAADSKPVLAALAEADWESMEQKHPRFSPRTVFYQLGATAKDGWTVPKDFAEQPKAMKQWLKDNAGKFRLQAYTWPGVKKEEPNE